MQKTNNKILCNWILEAIDNIYIYTDSYDKDHFFDDKKTIDACLMQMQHIWECIIQLQKTWFDLNITNKDEIVKFRNILSHQYKIIRTWFIRNIVQNDLRLLEKEIRIVMTKFE